MLVNGVNVERFANVLAKRWRRDRTRAACDMPELKSLARYSDGLYPAMRREVCQAIERRAREIFETSNQ